MAEIISNLRLSSDIYLLKVGGDFAGEMGQFYLLRAWETYPVLSRPLSIHNLEEDSISFLYQVRGKGTAIFSSLQRGAEIKLAGPYGRGFPPVRGRVALVGGGIGAAPLYLAGRRLKNYGLKRLDIYLGFGEEAVLEKEYAALADEFILDIGGLITERIETAHYDYILSCGPEAMMKELVRMTENSSTEVFVSIEKRMACGIGACLVCTCRTKSGNKKACKDGPVFRGREIYYD